MENTREIENLRDEASSPKRPKLRGGRGRKRVHSATQSSAVEQDQIMTEAPINQQNEDAISPERMARIMTHYRTWRSQGSPRDPHCFECNQGGDLVPCDTCRRQYHEACKPEVNALVERDGSTIWYCCICVGFGWHNTPPILTPPASPKSTDIDVLPTDDDSRPLIEMESTRILPRQSPATSQDSLPLRTPTTTNARSRRQQKATAASNATTPDITHRKSRFNTLPEEVDSALTTLYRELENIPFLQKKVTDLESELARVRQVVDMQRNELTMARRVAEKSRVSDVELQRLRAEAASKQAAVDEKEELKAKNAELESEVEILRGQLETATTTLQEWKQKLSNMIGT